ncbi:MAG TPA: PDZ domain-containing protein [Flavobacterium sp.]|jgi:hypothetical protein
MKSLWIIVLATVLPLGGVAQETWQFDHGRTKAVIPFQLINNLIIVPLTVNGVPLNFLLDSGVEETVLFSLDDTNEITFSNVETLRLRGLGSQNYIECMKSTGNHLRISGMSTRNHNIYIVLDPNFNFSSHIGIPVNGIIGYHFFKDNLVQIDYDKRKLIVFKNDKRIRKKLKAQYQTLPMSVEAQKPYIIADILQDKQKLPAKLLIDTGSSDAVWIFDQRTDLIEIPAKSFDDFLGRGFSGDINGKRARIAELHLLNFKFDQPIAAFPDSASTANAKMVENRAGSVGGEILRRFNLVFDYKNNALYMKKGIRYSDPFRYNMSGMELHHDGLQWVQETVQLSTARITSALDIDGTKARDYKYKFALKPVYCVSSVRKGSPADLAGLQTGDIIRSINNTNAFKYTLQEIGMLLKSEEGRTLEFEIERENQRLKVKFQLQSIL